MFVGDISSSDIESNVVIELRDVIVKEIVNIAQTVRQIAIGCQFVVRIDEPHWVFGAMVLFGLTRKTSADTCFDVASKNMIRIVPPEHNAVDWECCRMGKGCNGSFVLHFIAAIMCGMNQSSNE